MTGDNGNAKLEDPIKLGYSKEKNMFVLSIEGTFESEAGVKKPFRSEAQLTPAQLWKFAEDIEISVMRIQAEREKI